MQKQLQVISDALTTLQAPENALQAILVAAAAALGWWAAKYFRSRITVARDPDNLPDRLRELLYVGAPQSLVLAALATIDGFMHAFGQKANILDVDFGRSADGDGGHRSDPPISTFNLRFDVAF